MAGRPPLEIGKHGKITRVNLGGGIWRARARYRALDGVVRSLQRDTPTGMRDTHGVAAESALRIALTEALSTDNHGGAVAPTTTVLTLIEMYRADMRASATLALRTKDTYERIIELLVPAVGGLRVREATPRRLGQLFDKLAAEHRAVTAKQARTILTGAFSIAVREGAVPRNPVRDTEPTRVTKQTRRRTQGLEPPEMEKLLEQIGTCAAPLPPLPTARKQLPTSTTRTVAQWADEIDLADVIVAFLGTGLRRSEVLGLRWVDLADTDDGKRVLLVVGHVVRVKGVGLIWEERTKSDSSQRKVPVPDFMADMLDRRRQGPRGDHELIFPSSVGTPRDADNLAGQWRRIRGALGFEWVELHDFRRTVATQAEASGQPMRAIADHLGHKHVSVTHGYLATGRVHRGIADILDKAVGYKNGE